MRLAALIFAALLLWALTGRLEAAPIFEAHDDTVRVILYDDPCALDAVSNLPHRATWAEGGQSIEGCWSSHPSGFVVAYWADRSVVIMAARFFRKVERA